MSAIREIIGGRFRVESFIRQGGMGAVYRGLDTLTQEPVAIKILKPEIMAEDPTLVERFTREAEVLRSLNHPNIVKMIGMIQQEGRYHLVMEYVGGGTLAELIAAEPQFPIRRAVEIGLDLADALTRTHRLNILHRDIKPGNILMAEDGTPRLTDFGVARIGDSLITNRGEVVGTYAYLSPEALAGDPLDVQADIWSFGVLLYEMLAGRRPFDGKTLPAITQAILYTHAPDLASLRSGVPLALTSLVYEMMQKDKALRLDSVRLVGITLESILRDLDSSNGSGDPNHAPIRATTPSDGHDKPATSEPFAPITHLQRAIPHNLPVHPTAFIGREEELRELSRMLDADDTHLVTVIGTGGVGKTRLAIETAAYRLNHHRDGAFFVSLASIESPDLIVSTIADALNFCFYPGEDPRQQILNFLREKEMLLLLDNFEHLLPGALFVADVLQAAPRVKIIVTSRERLNIQGEHLFRIEGMNFPEFETPENAAEYSAVRLFLHSARRVQPDFALTADNLKYMSRICRLVGGLPLGILLAAAWVENLSLDEIAQEISTNLDFLHTDLRDLPERQRSMRAVFDYSWKLLSDRDRQSFARLSVFRGGFTREAAHRVAGADLKALTTLVNKSLIRREGSGRYNMHEVLRQYAEEALQANAHIHAEMDAAHSRYYVDYLAAQESKLRGPRQKDGLDAIEIEIENVRAAWRYAVHQKLAVELGHALESFWRFFWIRARFNEGLGWLQKAVNAFTGVTLTPEATLAVGRLKIRLAYFMVQTGASFESIGRVLEESYQVLRGSDLKADLSFLMRLMSAGNKHEADQRPVIDEALRLARESGDKEEEALSMLYLSWHLPDEERGQTLKDLIHLTHEAGIPERIGDAYRFYGEWLMNAGRYDEAARHFEDGLAFYAKIGDKLGVIAMRRRLGETLLEKDDMEGAARYIEGCIEDLRQMGNDPWRVDVMMTYGYALIAARDYDHAESVLHEAIQIARQIDRAELLLRPHLPLGLIALERGDYSAAHTHYTAADPTGNGKLWVRELGLAYALIGLGRIAEAGDQIKTAVKIVTTDGRGALVPQLMVLLGAAEWLAVSSEPERALELGTLVSEHPGGGWWLIQRRAKQLMDQLGNLLTPEDYAAAQQRGRSLDMCAEIAKFS